VNDAPVSSNGAVTTNEDTPASGTLVASDIDHDALTYSIVANGTKGSAVVTNPATGAFSYTPNLNANGTDSFTFKTFDGLLYSNTATVTVTITPVNDAPVAASRALAVVTNTAKAVVLTATDVDGDALTYAIASQPAHGTVALSGATATYTPATGYTGADAFTFTAKDPFNAVSSPATISISVANPIATTSTLTATAAAQYSDIATFTVTVTPSSNAAEPPATLVDFKVGTQVVGRKPLILSNGVYTATWSDQLVEPANGAAPVGQMKPGLHVVAASFVDPSTAYALSNPASKSINIAKEDAHVALVGPTALSLSGGTVRLTVSVTEFGDTTLGDIKLANVQFWNRATSAVIGTVNVAADGTATLNWATTPGTYSIGFVVGNYYLRNNAADNVSVTVK
jgi:VCBS repeat-containing protein